MVVGVGVGVAIARRPGGRLLGWANVEQHPSWACNDRVNFEARRVSGRRLPHR